MVDAKKETKAGKPFSSNSSINKKEIPMPRKRLILGFTVVIVVLIGIASGLAGYLSKQEGVISNQEGVILKQEGVINHQSNALHRIASSLVILQAKVNTKGYWY